MDERAGLSFSPYHRFTRAQWAELRADTPLTLTLDDLTRLQSINEPITLEEVIAIYLPLSRLLALYVAATQGLFKATQRFLGADNGKVPYIIGVAGSVAAGKSTFCRVMQALLARWPNTPRVELVTTDGFLLPNAVLESEGLMGKKGFPESYDGAALLRFISDVKAGRHAVAAPVYSHLTYDIVEGEDVTVDQPDILIVEGLNVLLPGRGSRDGRPAAFVSDYFDFSVYLDAAEGDLERWYIERFMRLRKTSYLFPQICRPRRCRRRGPRPADLARHQPRQPPRERAAHPRPRQPRSHQGREPRHRGRRPAQAVASPAAPALIAAASPYS